MSPYNLIYDEFAGVLYGPGQGTFMRQNTDNSVFVYNEIDEISPLSALSNILASAISPESDKSAENLGIKNNGLL